MAESRLNQAELLRVAYAAALRSVDPSTQNGAVLCDDDGTVLHSSCNCFPYGVVDKPERWVNPVKYRIITHAESNLIYYAAAYGIVTYKLTMVCPWSACTECAKAIIQARIKRLVRHRSICEIVRPEWSADIDLAMQMLGEAGVEVIDYDGKLGCSPVRFNGKLWEP